MDYSLYTPIFSIISAFGMAYVLIPPIINVAKRKQLYDVPNGRSSHTEITPSLGGIGIFASMVFSVVFWADFETFPELQYILGAFMIIFIIGVRDDIMALVAWKKLIGQIAAALILIIQGNLMITSLYGVFGVEEIPYWVGAPLTLFTYIVIINSVNLIDGINGLAGSIAALVSSLLGLWFLAVGDMGFAILSLSLFGALIGFLKYNFTPAKIFMGDTGSLLVGLTLAILSIHFIEFSSTLPVDNPYKFDSVPAIMVSLLILPLFDTARVFLMRMLKGRSPFSPDKTHIHHILLDLGLTHMQSTAALVIGTLLFFGVAFLLQGIGTMYLVIVIVVLAAIVTRIVEAYAEKTKLSKS